MSQAHCRLMYRKTILPMDAVIAVSLVDLSMQDCTLNDTVDALHSTTPKYSDFDYLCTAKKLLTRLNLLDIWRNELLYYAKLLQVDHKTLESDIESGNCKLFAKHDDVTDDNIHLSSTLITSSYFNNNKKSKNDSDDQIEENNGRTDNKFKDPDIHEKFAVTLKKHSTLNKAANDPSNIPTKKANKRKRKEVVVDSRPVKNKLPKKGKKSKNKINYDDELSNSENEFEILNAVPSVNDALADLGLDFSFMKENNENIVVKSEPKDLETSDEILDISIKNNDSIVNKSPKEELNKSTSKDKTINKLKMFQFSSKKDFDKYDEKPGQSADKSKSLVVSKENGADLLENKPSTSKSKISMFENLTNSSQKDKVTNISELKGKENSNSLQKVSTSSQLSIFESSDCDIDFDI